MKPEYIIEPLQPSHRESMLDMISLAFSRDDPLARSQAIDRHAFREFIEANVDSWYGLSWAAVEPTSGAVAAVVLAEDHINTDAGEEGSHSIAALINAARRAYFTSESPPLAELFHIHFIACDENHRRQGLVQQLVNRCLAAAADRGFSRVIVEASGTRSRRLFGKKLGFVEKALVPYHEFRWQDRYPFSRIAEHEGLVLLEKTL